MKKSAIVISVILFAVWYINSGGLYLIPAMIFAGAALGVFGLFAETIGWAFVGIGGLLTYEGQAEFGVFLIVLGIIVIKCAKSHGLLYDMIFASSIGGELDDEL